MNTPPEEPTLHELVSRLAELEQAHARLQEKLESSSETAPAAKPPRPGVFASDVAGTPAVSASGTNGADGVDANSDSGTGISATSGSGTGLVATSSSGLAGHFVGNVKLDNALTVAGTLSSGAGTFVSSASSTPAVKATGTGGADGVDASSDSGAGVLGRSSSSTGVLGTSSSGNGVAGTSSSGAGVVGESSNIDGVFGTSSTGNGVHGKCSSSIGVFGESSSSDGVFGISSSGNGVHGFSSIGNGVHGKSTSGLAGFFEGNVTVTGTLSKGGGSFKIDHPLDPAHKYLSHSFVESPDMKNFYDGVVTLDANGEAEVTLPIWFDTLNTDFRYQLTALGNSAPDLYIAEKIRGNRFRIAGGLAGMEVSWMVTGTRQDAWANAYRIPVEQDKPAEEQGFYLHPELYEQLEQPHIMRARHPELPLPTGPR